MAALDQKTAPILAILIAGLLGYMVYTGSGLELLKLPGITQSRERIKSIEDSIARFEAQTDTAKKQLAQGTIEDIRRRVESYRASLQLLRQLVPDRNEVPNLLDDISTRAKIRGVNVSALTPLPVEPGPVPFDTHKYQISVLGHYDQIGEFLSDIATLQRIIVPADLQLNPAQAVQTKALGDSTGAMLEARFLIRTYVKTAQPEGQASGT